MNEVILGLYAARTKWYIGIYGHIYGPCTTLDLVRRMRARTDPGIALGRAQDIHNALGTFPGDLEWCTCHIYAHIYRSTILFSQHIISKQLHSYII